MLGVKKTKKNYVKSLVFGPSAQAGAKQITKLGVHRESMGIYGHLMMLNGDLMMFNGDLMVFNGDFNITYPLVNGHSFLWYRWPM